VRRGLGVHGVRAGGWGDGSDGGGGGSTGQCERVRERAGPAAERGRGARARENDADRMAPPGRGREEVGMRGRGLAPTSEAHLSGGG
jgi:hypothetical protein